MKPEHKIKVSSLMAEVYKRQRESLLAMLRKLTNEDNELAEDILHDAVIKVLLWDGQVYGFEHLSVLFTKSVKQIWINHYSRTVPKNKKIAIACKNEEIIIDPVSTIDYYPYSKEVINRIKKLSPQQQQIINATFFEGLTYPEIALKLNIKDCNIAIQKKRAFKALKQ